MTTTNLHAESTYHGYAIETIANLEQVLLLEADWNRLSERAAQPNVFATFDWYVAWCRYLSQRDGVERLRPHVLTLKRDGEVRGIAPLALAQTTQLGMRLRRLQFAGRGHEWDYNDLLIGDNEDAQTSAVAEYLRLTSSDWDIVDLTDVRDTNSAALRIQHAMSRAGLRCDLLPVRDRCPYLPLDAPWDEMIRRRSRLTQKAFRNRQSRLRKMTGDAVRIRVLNEPHKEPGLLERMIELEKQKHYKGVQSEPFLGEYFSVFDEVIRQLGPKGAICVILLEWENRLLSWDLLFRCGNKLWDYLTVYDREFARVSPGNMLLPAAIDFGFAHGYTEYDYLSGEEAYKMQWATDYHHRARIVIWNDRWKSRLYAAAYRRLRARSGHCEETQSNLAHPETHKGE